MANAMQNAENLAMNQSLAEYKNWADYNNIVCMKSKMMFYSLKLKMGSKFNEFLSKFYSTYSFKTVNTNQFIRTAEEVYEDELGGFFGGWLNDYPMPGL